MTIPTREEALKVLDKLSSDYDLAGGWSPDPMPLLATLRSYIENHTGEPFAFVAQTIGGGEHLLSAHDAKQYVERDANLKPLYLHPASPVQPVKLECPAEYAHPFFVYDFMPQKIMFKSDRGDDTMALDVLSVRGWGHLIGHGQAGLKINEEAAAAIQDNFGKWVAKTLTDALSGGDK